MINAKEAAALYVEPPYTEEEVEAAIRDRAKRADFTCLNAQRLTAELYNELERQGFTLNRTGTDVIVEWKAEAA